MSAIAVLIKWFFVGHGMAFRPGLFDLLVRMSADANRLNRNEKVDV